MYVTIEEMAELLQVEVATIYRFISKWQVNTIEVDGEIMLNSDQFDFYVQQRENLREAYEQYLQEPIPEDIDVKDED